MKFSKFYAILYINLKQIIMVTEDYVSFEIAKLLKEKGFDEQTVRCYNLKKELCVCQCIGDETINSTPNYLIAAPTHQMAMKWIRESFSLYIDIELLSGPSFSWYILLMNDPKYMMGCSEDTTIHYYNSYEEACEAAIKYTLENLI